MSGCGPAAREQLADAAAVRAVAESRTNLPPWPPYCREHMGKVIPRQGEPVYGPQLRWEAVVDNGNGRFDWCANFYDSIRDAQARGGE